MDVRLRDLERAAALGDEVARRKLCYERIRLRPREAFRSPWGPGEVWQSYSPDRLRGQDVNLWAWLSPSRSRSYYVFGGEGRIQIGYPEGTEIPMNPLHETFLDTWLELEAVVGEDVWRKPWPWGEDRMKDTEDPEGDAYWRKVFEFEHDLRDVLDLSWCRDPMWWREHG